MSIDVSGLTDYKDQSSLKQLLAAYKKPKTASMATMLTGIKSAFDLHLIAATPTAQANSGCGFNASGTGPTLTARTLTTSAFKFEDNLCMRTLEAKYTQMMLSPGQDYSNMSVPQVIMEAIIQAITGGREVTDWTGTVAGSAKYDGIHTILNAESITEANTSTYVTGGSALTSITSSNALKMLDGVYNAIIANQPAILEQPGKVVFFIPLSWYAKVVQAYAAANYYALSNAATQGETETLPYFGDSRLQICGTVGLEGLEKGYYMNTSNLFLGVDAKGDEATPKIWFSNDNDTHRYSIKERRGWQVAYTSEVGQFACQNS